MSTKGRVRSLNRTYYQKSSHGTMMYKKYKGRIIIPQTKQTNYYVVYLMKKQKRKRVYIHRLVAETFLPNPENKKEVNHKDYNTHNNELDNLEWVTRQENINHAIIRGTHKKQRNYCTSATGEKYIGIRYGKYRLNIRWNGIHHDHCYETLEEAVSKREELLNEQKHNAA